MIARDEATANGAGARLIVTNLEGRGKHHSKRDCCQRGAAENLTKDWKLGLRTDKIASHRGQTNQCRLFLSLCAYWLLNERRDAQQAQMSQGVGQGESA